MFDVCPPVCLGEDSQYYAVYKRYLETVDKLAGHVSRVQCVATQCVVGGVVGGRFARRLGRFGEEHVGVSAVGGESVGIAGVDGGLAESVGDGVRGGYAAWCANCSSERGEESVVVQETDADSQCVDRDNEVGKAHVGLCGDECAGCVRSTSVIPPSGVGKHWARNRQWREEKTKKKMRRKSRKSEALASENWRTTSGSAVSNDSGRGFFSGCSEDVRRQLIETRAARLIEENKVAVATCVQKLEQQSLVDDMKVAEATMRVAQAGLRTAKAVQQKALLEASDLEKLKKMQETRVLRQTETNKVAVEKAFASLASSGNVPSLVGGHAVTIRSGSISPNSSASEAEVRKVQKDLADMTECMDRLRVCLAQGDFEKAKAVVAGEKAGLGEFEGSVGLTVPEGGPPSIWYDDGGYGGYIAADGRFHSMPGEYDNFQFEE